MSHSGSHRAATLNARLDLIEQRAIEVAKQSLWESVVGDGGADVAGLSEQLVKVILPI